METIIFSSKQDLDELKHILTEQISFFRKDAINYLDVKPEKIKEASFFLAEWLHRLYVKTAIRDGIRTSFDFLSQEEISAVKRIVREKLEKEKSYFICEIQKKLINLTEVSRFISLEGVWLFAMEDYRNKILELIEEALDEHLAEQDYREFLSMLHYFVELENSQMKELQVITLPNGAYRFYDENHRDITEQCIKMVVNEFSDVELAEAEPQNDILISLLIILLPEEIYLYGTKFIENKKFLITLEAVFADRIHLIKETP